MFELSEISSSSASDREMTIDRSLPCSRSAFMSMSFARILRGTLLSPVSSVNASMMLERSSISCTVHVCKDFCLERLCLLVGRFLLLLAGSETDGDRLFLLFKILCDG